MWATFKLSVMCITIIAFSLCTVIALLIVGFYPLASAIPTFGAGFLRFYETHGGYASNCKED
jgi:hypothetical protein